MLRQIVVKKYETRTDIIILMDKENENACMIINGIVLDKKDRPIANALVKVSDSKGESFPIQTDVKGHFITCIKCNENFKFKASHYDTFSSTIIKYYIYPIRENRFNKTRLIIHINLH